MIPLLTAAQMRQWDENTIHVLGVPSQTLMERAARAAIDVAHADPAIASAFQPHHRTVILCGGGNNGGDGFAMARFLLESGHVVCVVYGGAWADACPDTAKMSVECTRQYELWRQVGGKTLSTLPGLRPGRTFVVDALFGIGLARPIEGALCSLIERVNAGVLRGDYPILALDVPSGVHADTGEILGCAIHATATATFAAPKRGLLLYPGASHVGHLHICDIGIGAEDETEVDTFLVDWEDLSHLPARLPYANKGTFGRATVIGGASGMCGAAYLAAKTAYRAGAGLVEIYTDAGNRIPLQTLIPEAIVQTFDSEGDVDMDALKRILARADSVVLGCGLAQGDYAAALCEAVIRQCDCPLVLDADALNLLARHPEWDALLKKRGAPTVLTPHLGEGARLSGRSIAQISSERFDVADALAMRYGAVCVLKDARTVISDGKHRYLQAHGNDGMATGGSGDCLAGLIGSLLAQRQEGGTVAGPTLMSAVGVLVHAMAGDAAAARRGTRGLMASDIADAVADVLRECP